MKSEQHLLESGMTAVGSFLRGASTRANALPRQEWNGEGGTYEALA